MSARSLTIAHNGTTYSGEIMTIKSTSLGYESHGIFTASLQCTFKGGGVGVGGYALDVPYRDEAGKHLGRKGTAYGLDHIIAIMRTVGVSSWEALAGKEVIVLSEGAGGLGSRSVGIAGLLNDRVMILREHFDQWREANGGAS